MNIINILPPNEAQKIAAGEVIERPASVIKEIIENSIDANSKNIYLYIQEAGKKQIRIVDDGIGMSKQDAKICFLPHATSKIKSLEDLNDISSFGFRGEALASISAIAKITLITKQKDQTLGIKLECSNGQFSNEKEIACNSGTDLNIEDLFFNTPARRKFLKANETEWNQIQNVFYAFCLSHPKIHFKLFKDEKQIINAPKALNLKDRISQIWGNNFTENLLPLLKDASSQNQEVKVDGYISKHNFWRYGRTQIFFFVNGRYVKNQNLNKALQKGYLNVLPPGKYPAAFVFINVDTSTIDVNVHPRKEEVQFSKPIRIQNKIQNLIQESLEKYLESKLSTQDNNGEVSDFNFDDSPFKSENTNVLDQINCEPNQDLNRFEKQYTNLENNQFQTKNIDPWLSNANTRINTKNKPNTIAQSINAFINNKQSSTQKTDHIEEKQSQQSTHSYNGKIIGQLLNTYILIDQQDSLVMIDQHAAHERILYEQTYHYFDSKEGINLLFPETITLSENQLNAVLAQKDFFLRQGIQIEQIGATEIAIKTSPPKVQSQSLKELIFEIIDFIEENQNLDEDIFYKKLNEHAHGQMACKAAVKAGDKLSMPEMEEIVTKLRETKNKLICVHGRPTTWIISKKDIEKNFKRPSN